MTNQRLSDVLGAIRSSGAVVVKSVPVATAVVVGGGIPVSLDVEKVIFNPPATIVYWKDKTKTVVQCYDDVFSEEHGFAMACMRKIFGSRGFFKAQFKDAYRQPVAKSVKEDSCDECNAASKKDVDDENPTVTNLEFRAAVTPVKDLPLTLDQLMKRVSSGDSMGVVVGHSTRYA